MTNYHTFMSAKEKERYYKKVDIQGEDECWPWTGMHNSRSKLIHHRGLVWLAGKRHIASRIAWSLHHKKAIPDGLYACHHCDVGLCCNPKHIFIGDQFANMQDASRKGRTCRGSARACTNLNEDIVYLARAIYYKGLMRVGEIAEWFGIHASTCSLMLHGKQWAHVPMPPAARKIEPTSKSYKHVKTTTYFEEIA